LTKVLNKILLKTNEITEMKLNLIYGVFLNPSTQNKKKHRKYIKQYIIKGKAYVATNMRAVIEWTKKKWHTNQPTNQSN